MAKSPTDQSKESETPPPCDQDYVYSVHGHLYFGRQTTASYYTLYTVDGGKRDDCCLDKSVKTLPLRSYLSGQHCGGLPVSFADLDWKHGLPVRGLYDDRDFTKILYLLQHPCFGPGNTAFVSARFVRTGRAEVYRTPRDYYLFESGGFEQTRSLPMYYDEIEQLRWTLADGSMRKQLPQIPLIKALNPPETFTGFKAARSATGDGKADTYLPACHLTSQENDVLQSLVRTWDQFAQITDVTQDEQDDFRQSIHQAQRLIAARSVFRHLNGNEEKTES